MKTIFDPFADRRARDIRNSLSKMFVQVLTGGGAERLTAVGDDWLALDLDMTHRNFVHQQMQRYRAVIQDMGRAAITDIRLQALVLWNAQLFFELHELLETVWHQAEEPQRTGFKGLIQAAGTYVHYEHGHAAAARRLAIKAHAHLGSGAQALEFITNLDELRRALRVLAWPPPILRAKSNTGVNLLTKKRISVIKSP